MKRSEINQPPCYFDKYIHQVADIELAEAFRQSQAELDQLDLSQLNRAGDAVYADGKWTIKEICQHLINTEHLLAYRALRFARNDKTPLPGFDEAVLAAHVNVKTRNLKTIIDELKIVRSGTALLFASFDDEALQRIGVASDKQMSALAFGFTILGHQKHHLSIINAKYLPSFAWIRGSQSDKRKSHEALSNRVTDFAFSRRRADPRVSQRARNEIRKKAASSR